MIRRGGLLAPLSQRCMTLDPKHQSDDHARAEMHANRALACRLAIIRALGHLKKFNLTGNTDDLLIAGNELQAALDETVLRAPIESPKGSPITF